MEDTPHPPSAAADAPPRDSIEIAVPVFNEERVLEASVRRLAAYLRDQPLRWSVVIVDNGSADRTWEVASRLAGELPGVSARHLERRGRGLALRTAWLSSEADIIAYMDVDLSTDLACLLTLLAPLQTGFSQIAVGSRLHPQSRVERGLKREILSRGYNLILRLVLGAGYGDAQCGFKALRRAATAELIGDVRDNDWFFDTELLTLAERRGLRIVEVPVAWVEDRDSRVAIGRTVLQDLRGVLRLRLALWGLGSRMEVL
ncbi:MAG TPA: dolichyl-phosphate beta-glucosyltransferase [Candidatus Dormibacteraeota bacterium]|jgi:glycosyltransferase involved in cell wall biosynthesis|nr:dolichyl-phosphate beta-glucosyltransferase [Candidatus Dormibacteraeota bacterium]